MAAPYFRRISRYLRLLRFLSGSRTRRCNTTLRNVSQTVREGPTVSAVDPTISNPTTGTSRPHLLLVILHMLGDRYT